MEANARSSSPANQGLPPLPRNPSNKAISTAAQLGQDVQSWGSSMRRQVAGYLAGGHNKKRSMSEVELAELTDGDSVVSGNSRASSDPPSPTHASSAAGTAAEQRSFARPAPVGPMRCTYGTSTAAASSYAGAGGGPSSAGLPSALTTPKPAPNGRGALADKLRDALQLDEAAGGSSGSLGRGSDADAPDGDAVARGGSEGGALAASDSGQSLGEDAGAAGSGAASSSGRPSSAAPTLPASGSAQLDKYLAYLLTEGHPHKFLYYPEWGVSEEGCGALADFMRHDRRIRVMTLSGNGIGDEGAELLADGLRSNRTLTSLDLSSNKVGDVGALALAEALDHNTCLTELQLQSNRISDEGAEALAAALSSNATLKRLNLAHNPISAGQQRVVQHVLKTREYKIPAQPCTTSGAKQQSSKPRHAPKKQSLQFDIELSEALDLSSSERPGPLGHVLAGGSTHNLGRLHVAGSTAIAALSEPTTVLESSLGMQVAHIEAALAAERAASGDSASTLGPSATPSSGLSPAELVPILACRLAQLGYDVCVRRSAGAGQTQGGAAAGCETPRQQQHCFLRVMQPGEAEHPVIIDPAFREQFEVSPSTSDYHDALDAIPRVLVLLESRLWHLTEALARLMAACFEATERPFPPWRSASSMVSKWLPTKYVDAPVHVGDSPTDLHHTLSGPLSAH